VLAITEIRDDPGPGYEPAGDRHTFKKPSGDWCQFCKASEAGGCSIYEERPHSCVVYQCGWLQGVGTNDERPDKLKVVIQIEDTDEYGVVAIFYESFPGVMKKSKRAQRIFRELYEMEEVSGCAIIPSPSLPRRIMHKRFGVESHVPLNEQWKEGELLVDVEAQTVGGVPIDDTQRDESSDEETE
jgi:Fe-S-cluster containining protein